MRLRKTATAMALVLMASGLPAWADIEAAKAFLDRITLKALEALLE